MPHIIRRLPYLHDRARPPLLTGRARSQQIVLHVGIAPPERPGEIKKVPPPTTRSIPVVLDTGFTHTLLLRRSHLRYLTLTPNAQYRESDFPSLGRQVNVVRRRTSTTGGVAGEPVSLPVYNARLWIYPNIPGSWEVNPKAEPIFLPLTRGIVIAPSDDLTPSEMASPLFGLGGLTDCDLFTLAHAGQLDLWSGRPWWSRILRPFIR